MTSQENIKELRGRIDFLHKCLNIEDKRSQVASMQEKTLAADFWNDAKAAEKYLKEMAAVKFWVTAYDALAAAADDVDVLYEFAKESEEMAASDAASGSAAASGSGESGASTAASSKWSPSARTASPSTTSWCTTRPPRIPAST